MGERNSLTGDAIEVGRARVGIAAETGVQPRLIIRHRQQNIGALATEIVVGQKRRVGEAQGRQRGQCEPGQSSIQAQHLFVPTCACFVPNVSSL